MTALTERACYDGEFIVSEANGTRSRATATVTSGQNLAAGTVVVMSGGKLIASDGDTNTAGTTLSDSPVGILFAAVDASSTGANADVPDCVYIARDAEVKDALLTYGDEATDGDHALQTTALEALGIYAR